jgi:hypothetical protein
MIVPIFALELRQDRSRGRRFYLLPWAYAGLLALQVALAFWEGGAARPWSAPSPLSPGGTAPAGGFAGLVGQHFLALLLLTPAVTATAFSSERAKGTLGQLLTTALTSAEVVLGKLLARLLRLLEVLLAGLPVLCVAGGYADLPVVFFAALLALTALIAVSAASVGLVVAAWSKQASSGVLLTYAVLALGAVAVVAAPLRVLHPYWVLEACWGDAEGDVALGRLLAAALAWGTVAAAGLAVSVLSLRRAYSRQLGEPGQKRGRAAPRRAPVGDDPIRWKECHVEGLAPLRLLRRVPRHAGVLAVALLSAGASLVSLRAAWDPVAPSPALFVTQASASLVVAALIVTVRCAGAVAGERERQTWESLLLTPLDGPAYLGGRVLGLRDAVAPYFVAYAVPVLVASLLGGVVAALATVCGLLLAWPVIYYAATCGLRASVSAPSAWRGMVTAVFHVYVTGVLMSFGVSACAGVLFAFLHGVIDPARGSPVEIALWVAYPVASSVACGVAFVALADARLRQAERDALVTMPEYQFLTEFGSNGEVERARFPARGGTAGGHGPGRPPPPRPSTGIQRRQ